MEETRVEALKREHYEEIIACQQIVSQACMSWLDAKSTAAARKKTYEGALDELQSLIRSNPLQPIVVATETGTEAGDDSEEG